VIDLLRFRKTRIPYETEDNVMGARAMAQMEDASEEKMNARKETTRGMLSFIEIGEVQGTSRLEDTTGLPDRKQLRIWLEMVEHKRGQDPIERRVGIG
jgi:hypothetical protein